MSETPFLLGIDGGGTSTTAWLAAATDPTRILGRGSAGPSNIRAVGNESGLKNLDRAIQAAFEDAGLPRSPVAAACFGLAGADRETDRRVIEEWASRIRLAQQVRVVNDALPILYAADPAGCGVALIVGTGSLALGRNPDGRTFRAGGWGHLLGDEGSGYTLALAGLRAAARSADGRLPPTSLLPRFLQALDRTDPTGLVTAIYHPDMDRTRIASFARVVFEAAEAGDSLAFRIINEAALELVEMIAAVVRQLDFPVEDFPLALTGGVILNQPLLREASQGLLLRRSLPFREVRNIPHPVAGALVLAAQSYQDEDRNGQAENLNESSQL